MTLIRTRRVLAAALVVCLAIGSGSIMTRTMAQNSQVDLSVPDSLRQTIEQHAGKRVRLKLVSGQDLEGTVSKVGSHAVSLTELAGMEFFDATIRLDQVAAVVVRRATK